MGSLISNWNEEQKELVKNLCENGGYLFIPERTSNDDSEQKQKRGIVFKIDKGGKISDAVLSFGYKKTRLDKANIVGLSIEKFEKRASSHSEKLKESLNTITDPLNDKYSYKQTYVINEQTGKDELVVTFHKAEEFSFFDFSKIRESSKNEFDKYKNIEEVRNKRHDRALKNPSDPLCEKVEYEQFKLLESDEDVQKAGAKGISDFNKNGGIKRLYKLRQQTIAAKKRTR